MLAKLLSNDVDTILTCSSRNEMLSNKLESRDAYDCWLATDIVPTNIIS